MADSERHQLLEVAVVTLYSIQTNKLLRLAALVISLLFLNLSIGCAASGQSVISGRVIAGTVGQSLSAEPGDERFDEPGIPGAKITILKKGGSSSRGRGVYTSTTSDAFGNFEIAFANGQFPRDAVQVRVEGEGIYTSRSSTFLPNGGGQLLCVVITRPGYVIPEPPEDAKDKRSKKKSSGGE
jgi:hypothetical protein